VYGAELPVANASCKVTVSSARTVGVHAGRNSDNNVTNSSQEAQAVYDKEKEY